MIKSDDTSEESLKIIGGISKKIKKGDDIHFREVLTIFLRIYWKSVTTLRYQIIDVSIMGSRKGNGEHAGEGDRTVSELNGKEIYAVEVVRSGNV